MKITIEKEVRINQKDQEILLEKGDKIEILQEYDLRILAEKSLKDLYLFLKEDQSFFEQIRRSENVRALKAIKESSEELLENLRILDR